MIPRKSAKEIEEEIVAALEAKFNTKVPLQRGFNRKLAKTLGGTFVALQKMGGSTLLCMHPKTAPYEEISVLGQTVNPLKRWGELVGIERKNGQKAERTVLVTVLNQGGTLTSGEIIRNPDTQFGYQVVGDVPLNDSTVTATIRALRVGELGNVDPGNTLYFENAPDDVEKAVIVMDTGAVTGTDEETIPELRERILERYVARPQGGSAADFKLWAEEVEGVLNAYPYSGWEDEKLSGLAGKTTGAGQVFIFIEAAGWDGTPNQTLLDEVKDYIEYDDNGLSSRRNINAEVLIFPIWRTTFDITIRGLAAVTDEQKVQTAVEEALDDFMQKREPGGHAGYTLTLPRKDTVSQSEVAGIAGRVAAAYGGIIEGVELEVDGDVTMVHYNQEGEKSKLGTVTWI